MLVAAMAALGLLLRSQVPAASAAPSSSLARYKPTKPAAVIHFEAGNRAYRDARDVARPLTDRVRDLKRAIDEYTAGQALDGAAAFDYNIAHCARLLVDNATAVAHLQRFLERADELDAELRRSVEDEIAELDPSGAIRALPGQTHAPHSERGPPPTDPLRAQPLAADRSAAQGHAQQVLPAAPPAARTAPPPRASRTWPLVGWGLIATGVLDGGVAAWLAFDAAGLDRDAQDTTRTISSRVALEHRADARRNAAVVMGIGGGAAVVLGVVTLLRSARADASAASSAWNLGVTRGGVAVIGRF
jgi:hypothetical protein